MWQLGWGNWDMATWMWEPGFGNWDETGMGKLGCGNRDVATRFVVCEFVTRRRDVAIYIHLHRDVAIYIGDVAIYIQGCGYLHKGCGYCIL